MSNLNYLTENQSLTDIKAQHSGKLIVLIAGHNLDTAEKEKYKLLMFIAKQRKDKSDILIENELNTFQGVVLIFKENQDYRSWIKKYQNNERYYQKEQGQVIQDKVKIL